jgi:hypothetical protein
MRRHVVQTAYELPPWNHPSYHLDHIQSFLSNRRPSVPIISCENKKVVCVK